MRLVRKLKRLYKAKQVSYLDLHTIFDGHGAWPSAGGGGLRGLHSWLDSYWHICNSCCPCALRSETVYFQLQDIKKKQTVANKGGATDCVASALADYQEYQSKLSVAQADRAPADITIPMHNSLLA